MIYFLQVDIPNGPIKIGYSRNPRRRVKGIRSGFPYRLRVLGYTLGSLARERRYHKLFSECRIRGEWFSPTAQLLRFIERKAKTLRELLDDSGCEREIQHLTHVNCWLTVSEFTALNAAAKCEGISMSLLTRKAILWFLEADGKEYTVSKRTNTVGCIRSPLRKRYFNFFIDASRWKELKVKADGIGISAVATVREAVEQFIADK